MTVPTHSHSPRYNRLKKRALEVFQRHGGWLRPPECGIVRFLPNKGSVLLSVPIASFRIAGKVLHRRINSIPAVTAR